MRISVEDRDAEKKIGRYWIASVKTVPECEDKVSRSDQIEQYRITP